MEAPALQPARADLAWERVRRWPGLRGEAKLAWHCLWRLSRGGRERIVVTSAVIATDQGTSSDAGRRQLLNLLSEGLVQSVDRDKSRGTWEIEVLDPAEVARARKIEWDGQYEFDFGEDEQDTSGVPATDGPPASAPSCRPRIAGTDADPIADPRPAASIHGPRPSADPPFADPRSAGGSAEAPALPRRRTSTFTSSASASRTSTSGLTSTLEPTLHSNRGRSKRDRGSAGASAEWTADPETLGGAVQNLLARLPSPAERMRWVDQLVEDIRDQVGDPDLRRAPCLRIAHAIAEGRVERIKLQLLLAKISELKRSNGFDVAPWAYFVGAVNKILSRS